MNPRQPLAVDQTVILPVNGSSQRVRICAARRGLPPLLIVQAGPGLPMLHEVAKFQRLLHFEDEFQVAYWEQRGCGNVPVREAKDASLRQQVDDLQAVLRWLEEQTRQPVLLVGISLGATVALLVAEREPDRTRAVVAISADSNTRASDTAADAFIQTRLHEAGPRLRGAVTKMGRPPYVDPQPFQRRARVLADLGAVEHGRTFAALLRETVVALIRRYGVIGTIRALRNMNAVQRRMLPDVASLDLFAHPPRLRVPVHYVFGEQDALTAEFMIDGLPRAISAPDGSVVRARHAGHMAHFDQPSLVRSVVERAVAAHA